MVPALRPLGVCFISCGEAHTAVLTMVRTIFCGIFSKSSRLSERCGFSRTARFSLLARAATGSSDTVPQLMNSDPDSLKVLADMPHRSPAAGERLEVVYRLWGERIATILLQKGGSG